jgi:hypothetical protein
LATDGHEISTRSGNPIELAFPGPFVVAAEKLPDDCYIAGAEYQEARTLTVQLSSHGATAEGLVVDSVDKPLAGAVVVAVPQGGRKDLIDNYRITTTDQNGQFVLHGLAPTPYDIYAWEDIPDGAYYDPDYLAGHPGTVLGINVHAGAYYPVKVYAASADEE